MDFDPLESTEQRRDAGFTKEDVERLIVDENLGELDRLKMFLSPSAHQLQQSCAVTKLPHTFHEYGLRAYHALIPTISGSLDQFSPQMQAAAGDAMHKVVHNCSLPKEVVGRLLPIVLNMLTSDKSDAAVFAWLETLCEMVPYLPRKVLTENLLKLALTKGQAEETIQSKIMCARIYGAVAPLLEGKYVEQNFLQKAMALCQDTDMQVRACMCRQLYPLSLAIGLNTTEELVLPELSELLKDEEASVQHSAIECLLQMLELFPPQTKQEKFLPIIRSFCGQNDPTMLPVFGELMVKMGDMQEEDTQALVDAFKSLCSHEDERIRRLCAYNLPAVLKCMGTRKYVIGIQTMYMQLVQDPSPLVRATIASSFHEISKMVGKEKTALYLKEPLILLLKDSTREVLGSLVPILQYVLGQFTVAIEQQKIAIYAALIPPLLQMEKAVGNTNQWRLHLGLLNAFPLLADYISSEQIYENFVPVCFRYMANGSVPVRTAATVSLAVFIRNNRRVSQRQELSQRVVKEFGLAQSYWLRVAFVEFCESLLKIASSQMFKETFMEAAIYVLQDAVAAVRMRACLIIPMLKAVIKLPDDVQALERINFFATQRLNDNDRYVAAVSRSIADSLKHANIRTPGNEKMSQAEFEMLDKQKEEEEWNMLSKDEQDEKKKLDDVFHRMKLEPHKRTGHYAPLLAPNGAPSTAGTRFGPPTTKFSPTVRVKSSGVTPGALAPNHKYQKPPLPTLKTSAAAAAGAGAGPPSPKHASETETSDVSQAVSRAQGSNLKPGVKSGMKRA